MLAQIKQTFIYTYSLHIDVLSTVNKITVYTYFFSCPSSWLGAQPRLLLRHLQVGIKYKKDKIQEGINYLDLDRVLWIQFGYRIWIQCGYNMDTECMERYTDTNKPSRG
jgi:hypothetical protein